MQGTALDTYIGEQNTKRIVRCNTNQAMTPFITAPEVGRMHEIQDTNLLGPR